MRESARHEHPDDARIEHCARMILLGCAFLPVDGDYDDLTHIARCPRCKRRYRDLLASTDAKWRCTVTLR
jgi:hypothetical protein